MASSLSGRGSCEIDNMKGARASRLAQACGSSEARRYGVKSCLRHQGVELAELILAKIPVRETWGARINRGDKGGLFPSMIHRSLQSYNSRATQ